MNSALLRERLVRNSLPLDDCSEIDPLGFFAEHAGQLARQRVCLAPVEVARFSGFLVPADVASRQRDEQGRNPFRLRICHWRVEIGAIQGARVLIAEPVPDLALDPLRLSRLRRGQQNEVRRLIKRLGDPRPERRRGGQVRFVAEDVDGAPAPPRLGVGLQPLLQAASNLGACGMAVGNEGAVSWSSRSNHIKNYTIALLSRLASHVTYWPALRIREAPDATVTNQ